MKRLFCLIVIIGWLGNLASAQSNFSEQLKQYDDVCFCNVGLMHPKSLLNLDNNMEIVFACRTGKTLNDLKNLGIDFTKSQMRLLRLADLIQKTDSVYFTQIPILTEENTKQLRANSSRMAQTIIPIIQEDFTRLFALLNSKGLQRNSYSLFFAYVLDGLVWDVLEQNNQMDNRSITEEKPFWDGTFWMLAPRREFSCGTNSMANGPISINVNWSENSIIKVPSYSRLGELLDDFEANGKITQPEVIRAFVKYDLFDKYGRLKIPVITNHPTDNIYAQSLNIVNKIADYLQNDIDYSTVLSAYANLTKGQKITILYHEIMWDILDVMETNGLIKKPVIFAQPTKAQPADLKDVLFIVKE